MQHQKLSRKTLGSLILCGVVILLLPLFVGLLTSCNCGVVFAKAMFYAKLDDVSWGGQLTFEVITQYSKETTTYNKVTNAMLMESAVPDTSDPGWVSAAIKIEIYKVRYISGGPPDSVFEGVSASGVYQATQYPDGTADIAYVTKWGGDANLDRDAYFTFLFTKKAKINVNATLDGNAWTGPVNYSVGGPTLVTGANVSQEHKKLEPGTYTLAYQSAGPIAAKLRDITPANVTVQKGQTGALTMNFISVGKIDIDVNATLDGTPWTGIAGYQIDGPEYAARRFTSIYLPTAIKAVKSGIYKLTYLVGGPPNSEFIDVTQQDTRNPSGLDKITFTVNFRSLAKLDVVATLDGKPWQGSIDLRSNWPLKPSAASISRVPYSQYVSKDIIYQADYAGGGPPNAFPLYTRVSSQQKMTDKGLTLTFPFITYGTVHVNATLDGAPWDTACRWVISGPDRTNLFGENLLKTFVNVPPGDYTLDISPSDIPRGVSLVGILPSSTVNPRSHATQSTQTLPPGGEITYTFQFVSIGSITVTGSQYTAHWAGPCSYEITGDTADGPVTLSGTEVPFTFYKLAMGRYTITYLSGGPQGYEYHDIYTLTSGAVPSSTVEISAANKDVKFQIRFILPQIVAPPPAPPTADLSVTALGVYTGDAGTYTFTVTNSGPNTATGVVLDIFLPANEDGPGVLFPVAWASDDSGGTDIQTDGIWNVGDIASGATVTLHVNVTIGGGVTILNNFTATAEVRISPVLDPDSTPNNANPLEDDQASATFTS